MDRTQPAGIFSLHGVRCQVTDVARATAFYTDREFRLLLSGRGPVALAA